MHKEIADKWVEALRSGEYEQTQHALHDGVGFCCLGVLCDLFPGRQWLESTTIHHLSGACRAEGVIDSCALPSPVRLWAGLAESNPRVSVGGSNECLTELNDVQNKSFSQIADLIEAQWESM